MTDEIKLMQIQINRFEDYMRTIFKDIDNKIKDIESDIKDLQCKLDSEMER